MENALPELSGQTVAGPDIAPGVIEVLLNVIERTGPAVEQALIPPAVKVAVENPDSVRTTTVVDVVSKVIEPLAKVTFEPVKVQRYRTVPVTVPQV